MSIQLVLSHYLAELRERNELDVLLPELLKAMGHSVLSRPQIGVNQAGIDVVSTKRNAKGNKEVFLFVVKFGDLGRADFYGSQQAVAPSVQEACNVFISNRLEESLRGLHKRIVLFTNGILKQEAQESFSALSRNVAGTPLCSLEFWGGDQLTPLIEQYLFNETLLLDKGKADLRSALAGLEESETSIRRFLRFVDACFVTTESDRQKSARAFKRNFLKRCATASMGLAVLRVWGVSEGNLKPGVVAGEYLVLRMWAEAVKFELTTNNVFLERLGGEMGRYAGSLNEYFVKVLPQLYSKRAILLYRPERILYAELVFEELGRLSTLLLLLQRLPDQNELRASIRNYLIQLINEHTGCRLPIYDGQTIDITLVLAALMGESDWNNAQRLLAEIIMRLHYAIKTNKYLPVDTDSLEDAIALNVTAEAKPREFFQISSLVPALATTAALLRDEETIMFLRNDIQPLLAGVTLERWFPTSSLETLTGSRQQVPDVGVSRAIAGVRASASEELEASTKPFKGVAAPADFKWHGTPWSILLMLSARFHRHPVPTWYLAEYAPSSTVAGATDATEA